jgi:hypothetical protein
MRFDDNYVYERREIKGCFCVFFLGIFMGKVKQITKNHDTCSCFCVFSSDNNQEKHAWCFVVRGIKAILLKEIVCPFHIQETRVILCYSVSDF